jgi:hypothetical protein
MRAAPLAIAHVYRYFEAASPCAWVAPAPGDYMGARLISPGIRTNSPHAGS